MRALFVLANLCLKLCKIDILGRDTAAGKIFAQKTEEE
jgi:hypothetical protein